MKQLIKNNLGVVISRGKVFYHPEFDVYIVPTYHPSFILRNPQETRYVKEFTSDLKLARDLLSKPSTRKIISKPRTLKDPVDIKKYLEYILTKDSVTIDTETTGTDPRKDSITDISFCVDIGEGIHIEWARVLEFSSLLNKILSSDKIVKVFHGSVFDMGMLRASGFDTVLPIFDTMVAYHTKTMSREGGQSAALYGLKVMSWLITQEGGYEEILAQFGGIVGLQKIISDVGTDISCSDASTSISEEVDKQNYLFDDDTVATVQGIDKVLEDRLIECASYIEKIKKEKLQKFNLSPKEFYSAMDADVTHRIYKYLKYQIDQEYSYVFYNISMPLSLCLVKMHENGVRINRKYVETLIVENNKKAEEIQKEFFKEISFEFNLNSSQQVSDFMYNKLRIKPDKKYETKKGKKPSADEEAIIHFSKQHPILTKILDYRGVNKETSTYLEGYRKILDINDRVYPHYFQVATATGRLSCIAMGTKIQIVGGEKNIEDIIPGDLVYCYDDAGNIRISKVVRRIDNGFRETVKITWLSSGTGKGGYLVVTPDHLIRTKYKGWVCADHLKRHDKLFHLHRGESSGRVRLYGTNDFCEQEQIVIKREYFKASNDYHIHHIDLSKNNNSIKNLKIISRKDHTSINHMVQSVKPYNTCHVYDLEIETYHNFIANEICVHNCHDPNLQNLPRANRIRNMVIPSVGCKLLIGDLSQVELRVLAMVANDSAMIKAFELGHDFHTYTACIMFGIAMTQFNKENKDHAEKRSGAKKINFGIIYQMRAETLAADLKIKLEVAVDFMNKFFTAYPSVAKWINDSKNFARINGYVETLYGRKRYLPDISSSDSYTREGAERRAVNTRIQSCFYSKALIPTINGYKTIKELYELKTSKVIIFNTIKDASFSYSGCKDVYRYYFNDGTSIIATPDHNYKILIDGMTEIWKEIGVLSKDDYVIGNIEKNESNIIKLNYNIEYKDRWGNIRYDEINTFIDEDIGFYLGVSIGNGSFTKGYSYSCYFNHNDMDVANRIRDIMNNRFNLNVNVCFGKKEGYDSILRISTRSKKIISFLKECGFRSVTAKYKTIPSIIWNCPTKVICSFICGMFTTDGTVFKNGASYTTTSKELAYELGNLLNIVGIQSNVVFRSDGAFNVIVYRDFVKFNNNIGFFSRRKKDMTKMYFYKTNRIYSEHSNLPLWLSKNIIKAAGNTYSKNPSLRTIKSRTLCKDIALSLRTALRFMSECPEYKFIASGKYLKQIVFKEYLGKTDVYDVTILNGEPQLIVNSSLVHNCAGDISFIGIIRTQEYIDKTNKKSKIIGTVHDSILLDTPFDEVGEMTDMLPSLMTINIPRVTIPLKADIDVLDMWTK